MQNCVSDDSPSVSCPEGTERMRRGGRSDGEAGTPLQIPEEFYKLCKMTFR